VAAVTGEHEDIFLEAAHYIAEDYGESLSMNSGYAPAWQQQAPRTIDEALQRPDAPEWRDACNDEVHLENGRLTLCHGRSDVIDKGNLDV
jgi:hypothetical protein